MSRKIQVEVKLRSRKEGIEVREDGILVVRVNALPVDGRANERVIELLSAHFKRPKSHFEIIQGFTNKKKLFILKDF